MTLSENNANNNANTTHTEKLRQFIIGLPKAELHLHIEGTLEAEMIFALAQRNRVTLPYPSEEALRDAFNFPDLQAFLDLYYAAADVLMTEQDFYDLTLAYMRRIHADGVRHTEIMFDPQTHTTRGVAIATVMAGIARALREARQTLGISSYLILSFLRHLSEEEAFATLDEALPLRGEYEDLWCAVGLDSGEQGNPPEKFARVYARCRELGFKRVAHAGEEGPAQNVRATLDVLHADRIDHGVRSEEDPALIERLAQTRVTVCPLSNIKLGQFGGDIRHHNVGRLLDQGLRVTVNSDDPAYFRGYLVDNYMAVAQGLKLSAAQLATLARNSLSASFLPDARKLALLDELERYCQRSGWM